MTTPNPTLDLFRPQEVRRKSGLILDRAMAGQLAHVQVDLSRLGDALAVVLETARENYPDFQIPPYGVWRGFEAGGIDRWGALASARQFETAEEMLAAAADLAILTAFMKTRAPENWSYEDRMTESVVTGHQAATLAVFHMFAAGSFSSEMTDPYRVDAETLIRMDLEELAFGLQWDRQETGGLLADMQLHLKRFGEALALRSDLFAEGDNTRPGVLATRLAGKTDADRQDEESAFVTAGDLLDHLLEALAPVWEEGATRGDISLGDCFVHSGWPQEDLEAFVPFHLAAQEMVYSLVEPFAWAGFEVRGLEDLTAPSDLAHAALFAHAGALRVGEEDTLSRQAEQDRMIELRAVSAALTDRLADLLRKELRVSAEQLPLTCVLEAGTSRAGGWVLHNKPDQAKKLGQFLNPGSVFWLPFGA